MKSPPAGVRPTSDLLRGAVFDVLEAQGTDLSRVLDLYAGTGALGIESLSRGGGECDFVDRSGTSAAVIRENLRLTGFQERGRVHRLSAERAPERLRGPYSLVLADPPYDDDASLAVLDGIARSSLVGRDTTLVLEHSRRREAPAALGPMRITWNRRYGETQVTIFRE